MIQRSLIGSAGAGPSISRAGPPGVAATGHRPGSARSSVSSPGSLCAAAIQVEDQAHEHG
jgi:hypothetical protein